jgi:DNA-binding NtrC family response regulator/tetratricopeptide (TPR) repeat protein
MSELFADRFMRVGASSWIDIATGGAVRVMVAPAAEGSAAFAWDDMCATLARLRHPLLNPLVDYGFADAHRTFEAYTVGPPVRIGSASGSRALAHATRFLEAHGVWLSASRASLVVRVTSTSGRTMAGRTLGVTLQPRRVFTAVEEMLSDTSPAGASPLEVAGTDGSGLRTLQTQIARAARIQGYVPVCGAVLRSVPWLWPHLRQRHVCVLLEPQHGANDGAARLVSALGLESARRHVVMHFVRDAGGSRCVAVDPLGVTAMTSMIFADLEEGPAVAEVHAAARAADGSPGRFLTRLGATTSSDRRPTFSLVHESAAAYTVSAPTRERHVEVRRARSVFTADTRACRLAARGRHAAAERLLRRAVRVLEMRGELRDASRCAGQLGWILRDRGRSADALVQFEKAHALAPDEPDRLRCSVAIAITWTDERRFTEAEAALRSAITAAEMIAHQAEADRARLALARCLYWQQRYDEAVGVTRLLANSAVQVRALALAARIHAARGRFREAVAAANHASDLSDPADLRTAAATARARALAHCAIGDLPGVASAARDGLASAAAAHLPLMGLRIRAVMLQAMHADASGSPAQLAGLVRSALNRLPLPPIVRSQLEIALDGRSSPPVRAFTLSEAAVDDVQQLLEKAFGASDDRTAIEDVCRTVCDRLRAANVQVVTSCTERRLLARAGRPWTGDHRIVERALAAAASCWSGSGEPREAASPVKYAGQTVAVLACRWTASTDPDMGEAVSLLRAAALALAPSIRAVLDRPVPVAAAPALRGLIGSAGVMNDVRDAMARAARAPYPILIEGESGSGKELVARGIHALGSRRERRLCAVNCAALSEELLEAELFGHARGAFTGAVGERQGLFEEADAGTMFMDEVGELSLRAQAKLLRVLQDGEVRRVGENHPRRVDVRVIAATNRRLEDEVAAGRFRADLRFRLDVVRISVPPLRERQADIPQLAAHFWEEASRRVDSRATLAPETVVALTRFDWPGNVRQLQNVMASLAVHAPRRGRVMPSLLPAQIVRSTAPTAATFDAAREEFERRFVLAALAQCGGQRGKAARALGITRQGLAKMLRRLRIDVEVR